MYWKQAQNLAERTLADYRNHVSQLFNRQPKAFDPKFQKTEVFEYMAQPVKPATFNLCLIYLKAFFDWCIQEGIFLENPLNGFKRKKVEGRIVNIEEDVLTKLLSLPNQETFAGLRDYALLLLTLDTGIRPKEAFYLMVEDINFRSFEVCIRSEIAKTRTTRTLPISPVTAKAISMLIQARYSGWKKNNPVFCTSEGGRLTAFRWGDRMEAYSNKLGVWIRPYDLRPSVFKERRPRFSPPAYPRPHGLNHDEALRSVDRTGFTPAACYRFTVEHPATPETKGSKGKQR